MINLSTARHASEVYAPSTTFPGANELVLVDGDYVPGDDPAS